MNPGALIRAAVAAVLVVLALVPAASAARLPAPAPIAPKANAVVRELPAFSWKKVANADHYDFEISADAGFASPVPGNEKGKLSTKNTTITLLKAIPNGQYWWRVRAVTKSGGISPWTRGRRITMAWNEVPKPLSPDDGAVISFPKPATLVWSPVGGAAKYKVLLARDPGLTSLVYQRATVYTQATRFTPEVQLQPGVYYWNVTPVNAQGHEGAPSPVWSFEWRWPSTVTGLSVGDLRSEPEVFEPHFSWNRVPGATAYHLEVNKEPDFAPGSMVCCGTVSSLGISYEVLRGTNYTPTDTLDDNTSYYWRVRALDTSGNPGPWVAGPVFAKAFNKDAPAITGLRVRDNLQDPAVDTKPGEAGLQTQVPIVTWNPVPGASRYRVQVAPYVIKSHSFAAAPGSQVAVYLWGTNTLATIYTDNGRTVASNPFNADGSGTSSFSAFAGWYDVRIDGVSLGTPIAIADGCNWGSDDGWLSEVAGPYWTPLGGTPVGSPPVKPNMSATRDLFGWEGTGGWCVRVQSRSDDNKSNQPIYGAWTELRGPNGDHPAAFYGDGLPTPGVCTMPCEPGYLGAGDYIQPAANSTNTRMPLFTWKHVGPSYYVIVATDANFETVVDLAFTRIPAYSPRYRNAARTYPNDADLFVAVLPAADVDGTAQASDPTKANVRFKLRSNQPVLIAPANGSEVVGHPTFRWAPVEGARGYILRVASDPGFANLLESGNVYTSSTSYTSARTYSSDLIYWTVQPVDAENRSLTPSPVASFTRVLPAPTPLPTNIDVSGGLPTWAWSPVDGAAYYDIEITTPDGKKVTFAKNYSTASDPTEMTGTGIFSWRVQAKFPNGASAVGGRWSALQAFSRTIPAPIGTRVDRSRGLLLAWEPRPGVMDYRVEISRKEDFKNVIERIDVDGHSYAPKMTRREYTDGGVLYWRVAARDLTKNIGAWSRIQKLTMSPRMVATAKGTLKAKKKGVLRLQVTTYDKKKVHRAFVKANGPALKKPVGAYTNKSGVAVLRLTPKRKGTVKLTITKRGNQPVTLTVKVR